MQGKRSNYECYEPDFVSTHEAVPAMLKTQGINHMVWKSMYPFNILLILGKEYTMNRLSVHHKAHAHSHTLIQLTLILRPDSFVCVL